MKNLLLSTALILAPVALFALGYAILAPHETTVQSAFLTPALGDMTPFATIATDVQSIADKGDLAGAEGRITDLETAWDDAQATLRPNNTNYWGNVDDAIDAALSALRKSAPVAADVTATLVALQAAFADPSLGGAAMAGDTSTVAGVVITDENGRVLPCEVMLDTFRTTFSGATITDANRAAIADFEAKGTERCNADDDKRAAEFFAQGIALMTN